MKKISSIFRSHTDKGIRRGGLLVLAFVSGFVTLKAQQTDTASYNYSLRQCVDFALLHNSGVQNVLLDQVAADHKVKEVIGAGLPQISASGQVQDFLEIPTSLIPGEFFGGQPGTYIPVQFGTKYNASVGFSATQLVFNGSYFVGVQAAKLYQELAQKNVDRTKIETAADVTKAYYTVLVNNEKKKLLNANLERISKMVDDTKALHKNGFVEQLDVDRITVAYNNLATEVSNINRLLDLSIVLLKYQMGMDQSAALTLTDTIESIVFTPQTPANGKFDYSLRVEYQLYEMQRRGQGMLLRSERLGYLPTVALFGSATAQAQRTKFDFFDTNKPWYPIVVVGLQVNLPIFDGLQRHHRVEQYKVGILKAENDLLFIQRTIDMQRAVASVNLQNSSASLQSQKDNMTLAQSVFDSAKKKYDAGLGSNLEVINAQTALKEAQTNYFNALYDAVIAKVDYDKATGVFSK
ncbi:MAG: TolC family protein [Bacteroidota bacterium]|nr:TolC family protein [Bacteroidota bacterium]